MKKAKMELEMFETDTDKLIGRTHCYNYPYEIQDDIDVLEELKKAVKEPQVPSGVRFFYIHKYDKDFIGYDSVRWLEHIWVNKFGRKNPSEQFLLECSTEDEEWTKWRNEGLCGKPFRKLTLLPQAQEILITKYNEYIDKLTVMKSEMILAEQKEKQEKAERMSKWKRVKTYEAVYPSNSKYSLDGYIDADYQSKDGVTVRMVHRDVLDVGCYSYPKRVEGTQGAITREGWTESELSLCLWLAEFGEFQGIRM